MADENETLEEDKTQGVDEAGTESGIGDSLNEFDAEAPAGEGEEPKAPGEELLVPSNGEEVMHGAKDLDAVYDIPVQLSAVLGRSTMQVSQLLKLGRGAIVELDRKVGEAIDIFVNNRLVARGEVVVIEDRLGVTMTEIIKTDRGG
jgi:flagellar motor switch protein FliN/FliY